MRPLKLKKSSYWFHAWMQSKLYWSVITNSLGQFTKLKSRKNATHCWVVWLSLTILTLNYSRLSTECIQLCWRFQTFCSMMIRLKVVTNLKKRISSLTTNTLLCSLIVIKRSRRKAYLSIINNKSMPFINLLLSSLNQAMTSLSLGSLRPIELKTLFWKRNLENSREIHQLEIYCEDTHKIHYRITSAMFLQSIAGKEKKSTICSFRLSDATKMENLVSLKTRGEPMWLLQEQNMGAL